MGRNRAAQDPLDILILGPVPPPFGGISVHVLRLVPLLQRAGFKIGVLNHFSSTEVPFVVGALKRNPLNYYRLPRKFRARIVHYHHLRWLHLLAVALGKGSRDARYVLTLHAGDLRDHFPQLISRVPFVRRITHWALRRFDTVIVVDSKIASYMQRELEDRRIELIPAFLESVSSDEKYDDSVEMFLRTGRVLVVAAYGVKFLRGGREIYGVDTAVDAFVNLAAQEEDLRLIAFLARRPFRPKARRHLHRLERRLERAGVRERVLIVFGLPLVPALRRSAVFVRPTRAEGDALSIREALRVGVPVVASDVVQRPDGVVLFRSGDVDGLCAAIRLVLNASAREPRRSASGIHETAADPFSEKLIALYRRELEFSRGALEVSGWTRRRR